MNKKLIAILVFTTLFVCLVSSLCFMTITYFWSYEEIPMTEEDCFPEEKYDPELEVCYFECYTDEECEEIEKKIEARLEEIEQYYYDEEEPAKFGEIDLEDGDNISTYLVDGNSIKLFEDHIVDNELIEYQGNRSKHNEIWNKFIHIIPKSYRESVSKFVIFTDGKDETLAAVELDAKSDSNWILYIDIVDAYENEELDSKELIYTLIHEFAHILTLNSSQVSFDKELYFEEDESRFHFLFEKGRKNCTSIYFLSEGCPKDNSYINLFVSKYWSLILSEWEEIEMIVDEEDYYEALDDFYFKYEDMFITEYASTNPEEDIAESFTAFIIKSKPTDASTIADEKILFFYDFEELVLLRRAIRTRI